MNKLHIKYMEVVQMTWLYFMDLWVVLGSALNGLKQLNKRTFAVLFWGNQVMVTKHL